MKRIDKRTADDKSLPELLTLDHDAAWRLFSYLPKKDAIYLSLTCKTARDVFVALPETRPPDLQRMILCISGASLLCEFPFDRPHPEPTSWPIYPTLPRQDVEEDGWSTSICLNPRTHEILLSCYFGDCLQSFPAAHAKPSYWGKGRVPAPEGLAFAYGHLYVACCTNANGRPPARILSFATEGRHAKHCFESTKPSVALRLPKNCLPWGMAAVELVSSDGTRAAGSDLYGPDAAAVLLVAVDMPFPEEKDYWHPHDTATGGEYWLQPSN